MESNETSQSKTRTTLEIAICYLLVPISVLLFNRLGNLLHTDSLWIGVLTYVCVAAPILMYISLVEKKPLSSIGLYRITINELLIGVVIGIVMFLVQQLPFLIMGVDYKMFAAPPDWQRIIVMSVYCIVCVGFTEELMLRGFILHKSMLLFNNKVLAVILNCIVFYIIHWPPIRFVFGEFFNATLNTLILCGYFFISRKRSIVPLMIAHGVYDIISAYLLPVAVYYFFT